MNQMLRWLAQGLFLCLLYGAVFFMICVGSLPAQSEGPGILAPRNAFGVMANTRTTPVASSLVRPSM
jgi:hypothetical protein